MFGIQDRAAFSCITMKKEGFILPGIPYFARAVLWFILKFGKDEIKEMVK
jgi:hypothetical protein